MALLVPFSGPGRGPGRAVAPHPGLSGLTGQRPVGQRQHRPDGPGMPAGALARDHGGDSPGSDRNRAYRAFPGTAGQTGPGPGCGPQSPGRCRAGGQSGLHGIFRPLLGRGGHVGG